MTQTEYQLPGVGRLINAKAASQSEVTFDFVATTIQGLILIEKLRLGEASIHVNTVSDGQGGLRLDLNFHWTMEVPDGQG